MNSNELYLQDQDGDMPVAPEEGQKEGEMPEMPVEGGEEAADTGEEGQ